MGTTEIGLRYADSNSASTLWTHFQNLASDVNLYVLQRVANKAARLALTGVNIGRIVVELDTGRFWGRDASGWTFLGGPSGSLLSDTTATTPGTTGITAGPGWTLANRTLRNLGNGMAAVAGRFTAVGAGTVDTVGNTANVTVFTVPSGWAPMVTTPATTLSTGRMTVGYLDTDRTMTISAMTPGANIVAGDTMELGCTYRLADPSAI